MHSPPNHGQSSPGHFLLPPALPCILACPFHFALFPFCFSLFEPVPRNRCSMLFLARYASSNSNSSSSSSPLSENSLFLQTFLASIDNCYSFSIFNQFFSSPIVPSSSFITSIWAYQFQSFPQPLSLPALFSLPLRVSGLPTFRHQY